MLNNKFELYKLRRSMLRSGQSFKFFRNEKNSFGEPSGDKVEVGELKAIYHSMNSNIQLSTGDAVQVRTKKIPMLLCAYDDAKELGIRAGDWIALNGQKMYVTGIVNIQEWRLVADISLEVFDGGDEG